MPPLRSPLGRVTVLMGVLAVVFGALMGLDPRVVEGAPAWLKPAKFAVSTAVYSATLAWVLTFLPAWPRLARLAGSVTAWVFVGEVALIALQAARGRTSHFNTETLVDGVIFTVMGLGIALQTAVAGAVAVALWRQRFDDHVMGWALRLGMAITVAGASAGGMMTAPTSVQLEAAKATGAMPRSGAHTVGAPDGSGPGLPGTGWSTRHGDLRVPHFLGLHAIQAVPLVALAARRRRWRESAGIRAVMVSAASYAALFGILAAQALAGQPVVTPAGGIATALVAWALLSTAGATWARFAPPSRRRTATPHDTTDAAGAAATEVA